MPTLKDAPLVNLVAPMRRKVWVRRASDLARFRRVRAVPVFYDPAYRLPLASLEASMAVEPRRADYVVWYLLENAVVLPEHVRTPERAVYADLARVHTPELLEALSRPETLASIYAVDPSDVPVDETLRTVRLAVGGTLEAARTVLATGGAAYNLLGGFHHAAPDRGAAMCPVNDLAVAVAALRAEGFAGRVSILDLDAHPPDGTAACFAGDPGVWIGSISGSEWLALPGVDETVLPAGSGDEAYLRALRALLGRMPHSALAFVIAGGDVLAGDRLGRLGLTLDGARQRDLAVLEALDGIPSVWLPGGGYHHHAWKVLAGTVLALTGRAREPIPARYDPLRARYAAIWQRLEKGAPTEDGFGLSADDLEQSLRLGAKGGEHKLLGSFSAEAIEYAFHHCGILRHLQRLGYQDFRVEVDQAQPGDRMRLLAGSGEQGRQVLMECVLELKQVAGAEMLYVHWMALRNPRARFNPRRPQLPGQDAPGLGLAREAGQLLARMAQQMGLAGVAFRPSWYHMAYAARRAFNYLDPLRQGRFEAILRDLGALPLREATLAFAQGRVRMNGQPYAFEVDEMVLWLDGRRQDRRAVEAERDRVHFALVAKAAAAAEADAPEQSSRAR